MTGSRSLPPPISPSQLEDAYERLRSPMLESLHEAERGVGYGLIVQRGLLVWMRTCATNVPRASGAPQPSGPTRPLPPAAERDLVSTLVSLILGGRPERDVACPPLL